MLGSDVEDDDEADDDDEYVSIINVALQINLKKFVLYYSDIDFISIKILWSQSED